MTDRLQNQLDAYVDGTLSLAEQRAFEEVMRRSPELRAAVMRQRRIDESLRRIVGEPDQEALAQILHRLDAEGSVPGGAIRDDAAIADAGTTSGMSIGLRRWLRPLAVAAIFAAGLFGAWSTWNVWNANRTATPVHVVQTADSFYRQKVDTGWSPYWSCENAEQFASSFQTRLGAPLLLKTLPAGITSVGIDYSDVISWRTMAVLMKDHETPVLVLVDTLEADRGKSPTVNAGLHLYRRELGKLVLYEVTPDGQSDDGRMLDLFFDPSTDKTTEPNRTWEK